MNEKTDLVWLPISLVKKIKDINDPFSKVAEEMVDKYILESKHDMEANLQVLDEQVLVYRGMMIKARNAFKEAKEEQLEASYKLWEDFEKDIPSINKKVEEVKCLINPLKEELEDIKKTINSLDMHRIEKLIELIGFFNSNVYGETENILKYLMDNYKKESP